MGHSAVAGVAGLDLDGRVQDPDDLAPDQADASFLERPPVLPTLPLIQDEGDEDPDDPAKRKQARDITERVIRSLTERRIGPKGKATDVVDVEAPGHLRD